MSDVDFQSKLMTIDQYWERIGSRWSDNSLLDDLTLWSLDSVVNGFFLWEKRSQDIYSWGMGNVGDKYWVFGTIVVGRHPLSDEIIPLKSVENQGRDYPSVEYPVVLSLMGDDQSYTRTYETVDDAKRILMDLINNPTWDNMEKIHRLHFTG
jgi:hypothetical protein